MLFDESDPQKYLVYSADDVFYLLLGGYSPQPRPGARPMTLPHAQSYADYICRSLASKGFPIKVPKKIVVIDEKGESSYAKELLDGSVLISLGFDGRNEETFFHELAHGLDPWRDHHGPIFCQTFLFLIRNWVGDQESTILRECFDYYGVEYRKSTLPYRKLNRWYQEPPVRSSWEKIYGVAHEIGPHFPGVVSEEFRYGRVLA